MGLARWKIDYVHGPLKRKNKRHLGFGGNTSKKLVAAILFGVDIPLQRGSSTSTFFLFRAARKEKKESAVP